MNTNTNLPFYNPLDPTYKKIWPDYTLILPICAVGNVGQLACDLIVSTLLSKRQCELIGRIYSPALMSVVGPNAFCFKGPLTSSTEVYESKENKLVIVQQRTFYFKELKNIFVDELVNWIKKSQFDKVIVLSSSFAQCNPDLSQIGSYNSIGYVKTSLFELTDQWKELNINMITDEQIEKIVSEGITYLPGSGITKKLKKALEKSFIPAAVLIDFCSDGVNVRDCYDLANIIDKIFNLNHGKDITWVEPYSWNSSSFFA